MDSSASAPPSEFPGPPLDGPHVSLFATCLADSFYAEACADAAALLRHFGARVEVPPGQTCCGQPAYNSGHRAEAARMARHTARVFGGPAYVVLPSGSCAGMIRAFYGTLLGEGQSLPGRTFELTQFLVHVLELGREPLGDGLAGRRVAYHHGCHALRELGVRDEPTRLLEACGAEVVAWPGDTECCGFGGLFSTKFPEVSAGMADRKLDVLPDVDFVTSADGGCLMQLSTRARFLARREGAERGSESPAPATGAVAGFVHLATLLRQGVRA